MFMCLRIADLLFEVSVDAHEELRGHAGEPPSSIINDIT